MSGYAESLKLCPEELELLAFDIMGIRMAADTGQLAGVLKPEEARNRGIVATGLHERLHFRGSAVRYEDPHVLVLKSEGGRPGIVVDRPQEIFSAKIDAIRPMPSLLAAGGSRAVWGTLLLDGECILLVDFYKLQEGS